MDDSERSYGYSEDMYHGRRGVGGDYGQRGVRRDQGDPLLLSQRAVRKRSYEYGAERGMSEGDDLSRRRPPCTSAAERREGCAR